MGPAINGTEIRDRVSDSLVPNGAGPQYSRKLRAPVDRNLDHFSDAAKTVFSSPCRRARSALLTGSRYVVRKELRLAWEQRWLDLYRHCIEFARGDTPKHRKFDRHLVAEHEDGTFSL